jgi:hypothetical protein
MTCARARSGAALGLLALAVATGGACRAGDAAAAPSCAATAPVCGRDGHVYASACAARVAQVATSGTDRCHALVPGWAPCGARYCDARTSYCEIFLSDVPELPTGYHCRPLPAACRPSSGQTPGCGCLDLRGPSFCGQIVTGGLPALHVTWQGIQDPTR